MPRRVFWFGAGAAAGVWAANTVHRRLRALRPDSLAATAADRALDAGARVRAFARDVRTGMAAREAELNDALGLTAPDLPAHRAEIAYHRNRKDEH